METTLSYEIIYIIIILAGAAAAGYYLLYKKNEFKKEQDAYVKGLKFMAEGDNRQAILNFKEAVRQDSDNIDAYIKLANILQNENLVKNAIKIYKDLLLRGNMVSDHENEIRFYLGKAYMQITNYDKAQPLFEAIKTDNKYQKKVISYLLEVYEKRKLWAKAFDTLKNEEKKDIERMAYYRVMMGKELAQKGDLKDARIIFKDAIKINESCAEAYLQIGDSYVEEERMNDAINTWTDFCKKVPALAHQAFGRLEKAWYEKGHFSKIEDLYRSLLAEDENNLHAIIALANIYRKKGEYKEALKILQESQKKDLDQDMINLHIAKVQGDSGKHQVAAKIALEILEKKMN